MTCPLATACPLKGKIFAHQNTLLALALAVAVFVGDQISKFWALDALAYQHLPVIDGLLNFRLAMNAGVSFSFLADVGHAAMPFILAGVAFTVSLVFFVLLLRGETLLYKAALGMLIGGAVGNGVDRLIHGAVVDFLDVYYQVHHFPIFNIADVAINIGVALLLWDAIKTTLAERNGEK